MPLSLCFWLFMCVCIYVMYINKYMYCLVYFLFYSILRVFHVCSMREYNSHFVLQPCVEQGHLSYLDTLITKPLNKRSSKDFIP